MGIIRQIWFSSSSITYCLRADDLPLPIRFEKKIFLLLFSHRCGFALLFNKECFFSLLEKETFLWNFILQKTSFHMIWLPFEVGNWLYIMFYMYSFSHQLGTVKIDVLVCLLCLIHWPVNNEVDCFDKMLGTGVWKFYATIQMTPSTIFFAIN